MKKIWKSVTIGEISGRGNVLVGKCSVEGVCTGELSGWESARQEDVSQGSVLREVPVGKLSTQENVVQSYR